MSIRSLARRALLLSCIVATNVNANSLDEALRMLDSGTSAPAVEVVRKHARDGNAVAQLRLGTLYYHGDGVPEDENAALDWWKKAAASGSAEAMYSIANAYLFGNTAPKSVAEPDREAAIWCFKAASAGNADAAYTLGLLFIAGKGVNEDRAEAVRWFRRAADQGHADARKAIDTTEKASLKPTTKPKAAKR